MTRSTFRPAVSALTIFAFLAAHMAPLGQAHAAAAFLTRADYEACQARDERGFRTAVETITRKALRAGLAGMSYDAAVGDAWRRGGVDKIIDAQVDKAIKDVREESSWGELLKSLASKETAQELAITVATRVYRADPVKKAIEAMAVDVGKSVGRRIELATVDAAEPAKKCMASFLGARFGTTVARVVGSDAGNQLEVDSAKAGAKVSTGSVILQSSGGLAGAMVLIVRRQLSKIAARVGQRVLGAVLARLVSVVAGGIGIVLIAKDIWDMRHGVLPIISDEMKAAATKSKVREELSKAIKEQINGNIDDLGTKSADSVVQIWRQFRQAHTKVLELAEKHETFKRFLNALPPQKLSQTDEIVALTLAGEGEAGVLKRLGDGTLDEAVKRFSPEAMQIARDTRSLALAFQWKALAGITLPLVVKHDVHRRANPKDFTKNGLNHVFALEDQLAISRLVSIGGAARQPLFELETKDLTALARALPEKQLTALSRYLTGLEKKASKRLLFAVAAAPSKMLPLTKPRVRDALIASTDQLAAVNMMVRGDSVFNVAVFMEDVQLWRDSKVSPWLIWEQYPGAISMLGFVTLLLAMLLWRLIMGRRPKVIMQAPAGQTTDEA